MIKNVFVLTEFPVEELLTGVMRRAEHLNEHLRLAGPASSDMTVTVPLYSKRVGRLGRVLGLFAAARRVSSEVPRHSTAYIVGISSPHMLPVAWYLTVKGHHVVFDACDSWRLQARVRLSLGHRALALSSLLGYVLQFLTPRRISVSYIAEADMIADARVNRCRTTMVILAAVPDAVRGLPPVASAKAERFAVSGNYASYHIREGMDLLWKAWPVHHASHPESFIDVYGPNADVLPPLGGARIRNFADEIAELYAGATIVFVPNSAGSGLPNKLLEATAAQRPIVVHESLVPMLYPHPWVFSYRDLASLRSALHAAWSLDLGATPEPIRLRVER